MVVVVVVDVVVIVVVLVVVVTTVVVGIVVVVVVVVVVGLVVVVVDVGRVVVDVCVVVGSVVVTSDVVGDVVVVEPLVVGEVVVGVDVVDVVDVAPARVVVDRLVVPFVVCGFWFDEPVAVDELAEGSELEGPSSAPRVCWSVTPPTMTGTVVVSRPVDVGAGSAEFAATSLWPGLCASTMRRAMTAAYAQKRATSATRSWRPGASSRGRYRSDAS